MRNHKGVSLIEMLGAIAILSIVISLSAVIISYVNKAQEVIVEKSQANTTGIILIHELEESFEDMNITDYQYVDSSFIYLYSEYSYEFDETSNEIILITYDPMLSVSIEIDDELLLNGIVLDTSIFTIDPKSYIDLEIIDSKTIITFYIFLASLTNTYQFQSTLTLDWWKD